MSYDFDGLLNDLRSGIQRYREAITKVEQMYDLREMAAVVESLRLQTINHALARPNQFIPRAYREEVLKVLRDCIESAELAIREIKART